MVGGQRTRIDAIGAAQARVAARATGICDELGLVHAVAIDAAVCPCVLRGLLVLVAGDTGRGLQRGCLVRAMTVRARLIGMGANAFMRALRLLVTAHARGRLDRGIGAEAVAVAALEPAGPVDRIGVQRGRHRAMALLAQIFRRNGVRRIVAAGTRDLVGGDMRGVAGAGANLGPCGRDVARDDERLVAARSDDERDDEREDDERAGHRAPTG